MGQALCESLRDDYEIMALDINFDETMHNNYSCCIQCDSRNIAEYKNYIECADVIFYLMCTVIPHEGSYAVWDELDSNLRPLIDLMNYIVDNKLDTKMIFVSSGGTVYGETDKKTILNIEIIQYLVMACLNSYKKSTLSGMAEYTD